MKEFFSLTFSILTFLSLQNSALCQDLQQELIGSSWRLVAWKDEGGKIHGGYNLKSELALAEKRGFIEIYEHSHIADGLSFDLEDSTLTISGRGTMEGLIIFRTPNGPLRFEGKVEYPSSNLYNLPPDPMKNKKPIVPWNFRATVAKELKREMFGGGFFGSLSNIEIEGEGPYLFEEFVVAGELSSSIGRPKSGMWTVGESKTLSNGHTQTLNFGEKNMHGHSGCNSYSAGYRIENSNLIIDHARMTLVACSGQSMLLSEKDYSAILFRAKEPGQNISLENDLLKITNTESAKTLIFRRAA